MNLIERETLKGLGAKELTKKLEQGVHEYVTTLSTMSQEELFTEEAELMNYFQENDVYIKNRSYILPDSITFEGVVIKESTIKDYIIGFLNRLEVDWKSSLGIYQAIQYWKSTENPPIPYAIHDATIRLLGTLKFRGYTDCKQILIINDYLATVNAEYSIDVNYVYYLSGIHKAIMDEQQKLAKTQKQPKPTSNKNEASE